MLVYTPLGAERWTPITIFGVFEGDFEFHFSSDFRSSIRLHKRRDYFLKFPESSSVLSDNMVEVEE